MINPLITRKNALLFILLIGFSSFFVDMTHAGAKSIYGAYLNYIGASAAAIGFVSGLAQMTSNSLTLLTGYIVDKRKNYWTFTIAGYIFSLVAIPALALVPANGWILACFFIVLERLGKACWHPARITLISFTASEVGSGKSFSIQSALNKFGACIGPLMLFFILLFKSNVDLLVRYKICFVVLGIPAIIGLIFLLFAKKKFSHPENFDISAATENSRIDTSAVFLLFCFGLAFFGLGFFDFPLITMHLAKMKIIDTEYLPLFFSGAMLVSTLSALFFGRLFDKMGVLILVITTLFSSTFSMFVFGSNNLVLLVVGILIWGLGIGSLETILKSVLTVLVAKRNRSKGVGVMNLFLGISLFFGSWISGILYDKSHVVLIFFSFSMQLIAVVFFFICYRKLRKP